MSVFLDEILNKIEAKVGIYGKAINPTTLISRILTLTNDKQQEIISVLLNGTVQVNPTYTTGQAVDEFWKYIASNPNYLQLAVEQAKKEERQKCAQEVENQGKQWGIMRSMKMTHFAETAQKLADLLRK